MEVLRLDEKNIKKFKRYLTADVAERVMRPFAHGIVVIEGDEPRASLVWEQKNIMTGLPGESHIFSITVGDDEVNDLLFSEYGKYMIEEDIAHSSVRMLAKDHAAEKGALKKAGFKIVLGEDDTIRVKLSALKELPFFQKAKKVNSVHPLSDMSDTVYNETIRKMLFMNKFGLCEDIAFLKRDHFDEDVSCYYENDGLVSAIMLIHVTDNGEVKPELLSSWGPDSQKVLPVLVAHSVLFADEIFSPDDVAVIDRHNSQSLALVEKLFPNKIGVPIFMGTREEVQTEGGFYGI